MVDVYGNLNLKQNQPTFMVVHKGTSFPGSPSPVAGQLFYRTDEGKLYSYDGAEWDIAGGGGIGKFSQNFTSQTNITITHNLADANPIVQVYDNNAEQITPDKIDITDSNNVNLQFNIATSGFVIIHGGLAQEQEGGVGTYLHTQSSGSSSWTVTHNLNDLNPVVEVFDSSGNPVEPQSISITNGNALVVTFGSSQTGKVRVLAGQFSGGTGAGNFLPTSTSVYDIGSGTYKWKDAYFSGNMNANSIFLGSLASDPGSPVAGQIWFNSTDKQFKGYNGTSIVLLG
jgi:hypothetical protein